MNCRMPFVLGRSSRKRAVIFSTCTLMRPFKALHGIADKMVCHEALCGRVQRSATHSFFGIASITSRSMAFITCE